MQSLRIHERLKALDIELSPAGAPAAAYVMSAQSGNLVYLSGHIAKKNGKVWVGKLGATMSTVEGRAAARAVAIDLLSTLQAHTGDLNRVKRIVKVVSLVNSTPDFTDQHLVTNGASELFADVFGDVGRHARSHSVSHRFRWGPAWKSKSASNWTDKTLGPPASPGRRTKPLQAGEHPSGGYRQQHNIQRDRSMTGGRQPSERGH